MIGPISEAIAILSRCAAAARPSGRVVALSGVHADGTPKELTIENVLLGGKNRTLTEFKQLAKAADLEVISSGVQSSGYFVVECRPSAMMWIVDAIASTIHIK